MSDRLNVHFRYFRQNKNSIASLMPHIDANIVRNPENGIMLYSFFTLQADKVYREVDEWRESVDAIWVAGGPHPSAKPFEALQHFDYVVVGEGEIALPTLLRSIEDGKAPGRGGQDIPGVAYLKNGALHYQLPTHNVVLDECPPFDPNKLMGPIEISRGCPFGCTYCQTPILFGRNMRHRSIPNICKAATTYTDVRFVTPNALAYGSDGKEPRLEKVEALLSTLHSMGKRVFFGTFPSEVRPDCVSDDAISLIDKYCVNRSIAIGAQSGSERILKHIRRGHDTYAVYSAVELVLDRGFIPIVDFIFGFPFETEEDEHQSIEMVKWIVKRGGKVRAHAFMPLPSTPLENAMVRDIGPKVKKLIGKLALEGLAEGRWEEHTKG
ncbi:MAG: TIGR04013 family B12-binding domain/radical SAM domain-containing protein [Methermicoccaceae archaeon]